MNTIHEPSLSANKPQALWKRVFALIGLPCLISVAAIDPGNLEVDLQAGHLLGYRLIWALLLSSIIGFVLQALAARLTLRTGNHLAELCAKAYAHDRVLSLTIFAFAELSIVAFDLAEVVGTAIALQLLFGWPLWLGMILSALDTMLVLYLQRRGLTTVEILIEGMLFILAACLIYEFVLSRPSAAGMFYGTFVPTLGDRPQEAAILAIGILGSVIMAHNLFLHSWLIKHRSLNDGPLLIPPTLASINDECRYATIETAAIFFATFLINSIALSVTAALPDKVLASIDEIGLRDAGALFRNFLPGEFASTAWGVALLASGHAATVTGTLASQVVCEGFLDIREGSSPAGIVLATRAVAIIPALAGALIAGQEGADRLVVLSQVVLSLALPFVVIPLFKVLAVTEGEKGGGQWLVRAGYVSFAVLIVSNGFAVAGIGAQVREEAGGNSFPLIVLGSVVVVAVGLIVNLLQTPPQLEEIDLGVNRGSESAERSALASEATSTYS